jgi:hypothetical protein
MLFLTLQLLCGSNTKVAEPQILPPTVAISAAFTARRGGLPRAYGDLVIEGEMRYVLPLLSVGTIVFKPGSRLIISISTRDSSAPPEFYLLAQRIEVEDAANPGSIVWDPGPDPPIPPVIGQPASPGPYGSEEGIGKPGSDGADGSPGLLGRSAPSITIIVQHASTLPEIMLCGQSGGRAASGQPGGQGGRGGNGSPAAQSAFNCMKGPGHGGDGGRGGNGGRGGPGGQGGDGGTLTLLLPELEMPDDANSYARSLVRAHVEGGMGGSGGQGGAGGAGGDGGAGGPAQLPWCQGGGPGGQAGSRGEDGANGPPGENGRTGTVSIGFLNSKVLRSLIQGAK